ncbi:MAG TPA: amidohydrolase, partial [Pirellulales bacterium]|nr:amidohydrolase [Pirellulales bacterium]
AIVVLALGARTFGAEKVDLLIDGGLVVSMATDAGPIVGGLVAIRDDRIVAVGTSTELRTRYESDTVIDATGHVVMPGLVNTHGHVPMTLFRGIADDRPLSEWLQKYIFPAEAKLVDEAFVRCGTQLGCLEMIRGGTTTYVDMYYFEHAVADETAKAGMRGLLGETLIDFPAPDNKTWGSAIAAMRDFAKHWRGHPLITPAVAPHAPYTVSEEHLREAAALAQELDLPLLMHVAEAAPEVERIRREHGCSPVAYLDRLGILSDRMLAAHVVWADDEDRKALARNRVGVAHCPQSNMKLADGIAQAPAMLRAGIAVGLGADGAASNNDLDLWEEIDTAAKLHKVASRDPTVLIAREALTMATLGGARALNMAREIGSLEVDKRADIIVVAIDEPHQIPMYNAFSQLVYATKASDVRTVVINGRVVMRDRKVLTIDEPALRKRVAEYHQRIADTVLAPKQP